MKYKVGLSIPEKQTLTEDVYVKTCNGGVLGCECFDQDGWL